MCGVAGLALDHKQGVTGGLVCGRVAQQYVVDASQVVVFGQHQQAGGHALAGFVEGAAVLGVQPCHAFSYLLVEGVIGMLGLGRQQGSGRCFRLLKGHCAGRRGGLHVHWRWRVRTLVLRDLGRGVCCRRGRSRLDCGAVSWNF